MTEPSPHRFFTPRTAAIFRAIAACIVPGDASPGGHEGADSDAAIALADRAIAERPARDGRLIALFLKVVELLPVLRYGKPFSRLRPEQQRSVLAFLESNRALPKLRQGFFGVKTFALLGYYGGEECFGALHYPGPRRDAPYYVLRARTEGAKQ